MCWYSLILALSTLLSGWRQVFIETSIIFSNRLIQNWNSPTQSPMATYWRVLPPPWPTRPASTTTVIFTENLFLFIEIYTILIVQDNIVYDILMKSLIAGIKSYTKIFRFILIFGLWTSCTLHSSFLVFSFPLFKENVPKWRKFQWWDILMMEILSM